jgi:hypothetical protein
LKPLTGLIKTQVRRHRSQTAQTAVGQNPSALQALNASEQGEEEPDISSSEDESMTAEEQMEINSGLASLGIPPLIMQAIPISIVHEKKTLRETTPGEPIHIPSDSGEGNANPSTSAEANTNPEEIEHVPSPRRSPIAEVHLYKPLIGFMYVNYKT